MGERGGMRVGVLVLVSLLVVVAGAVAAVGIDGSSDARTGGEVLEDVRDTYTSAESLSADATVTVSGEEYEATYGVAVAAAGDDRFRLNVTRDDRSLVAGTDGDVGWLNDPGSGVTVAVERADEDTLALRVLAGSERLQGLSVTDLLERRGIDPNTTVTEFVDRIDTERLPANVTERLDELPEDTTLTDLTQGENLGDLADDPTVANLTDGVPNASALSTAFEDSDLASALEDGSLEVEDLPEEVDRTAVREFLGDLENGTLTLPERYGGESYNLSDELADLREGERPDWTNGEFDVSETNLTAERVGTTTVDGREAVEVAITHPDYQGETRVWTASDTDEVLRVRSNGPNATVTVDVESTQFNVSAADSTFEPPGAETLVDATVERTDDPTALGSDAPFEVATPGDNWTFEGGVTAVLDTSNVPVEDLPDETVAVAAAYTGSGTEERSVVVAQTETELDPAAVSEAETELGTDEAEVDVETVTVEGREVVLTVTDEGGTATWSEGGTTITVAGDVDAEELRAVLTDLIG
jgi:outer membrane lipoprotein-sorting protein